MIFVNTRKNSSQGRRIFIITRHLWYPMDYNRIVFRWWSIYKYLQLLPIISIHSLIIIMTLQFYNTPQQNIMPLWKHCFQHRRIAGNIALSIRRFLKLWLRNTNTYQLPAATVLNYGPHWLAMIIRASSGGRQWSSAGAHES